MNRHNKTLLYIIFILLLATGAAINIAQIYRGVMVDTNIGLLIMAVPGLCIGCIKLYRHVKHRDGKEPE